MIVSKTRAEESEIVTPVLLSLPIGQRALQGFADDGRWLIAVFQYRVEGLALAEGNVARAANLVGQAVGGDEYQAVRHYRHAAYGPLVVDVAAHVADAHALAGEGFQLLGSRRQEVQRHACTGK